MLIFGVRQWFGSGCGLVSRKQLPWLPTSYGSSPNLRAPCPDRFYQNFKASTFVNWRIWYYLETSIDGFLLSKTVKGSVVSFVQGFFSLRIFDFFLQKGQKKLTKNGSMPHKELDENKKYLRQNQSELFLSVNCWHRHFAFFDQPNATKKSFFKVTKMSAFTHINLYIVEYTSRM